MRICILSDYSGFRDEGMRGTAYHLCRELRARHSVLHQCLKPHRRLLTKNFWRSIKKFNPRIIHFIPGPTIKSFLIMKALKLHHPRAKTIMSATLPVLSSLSKRLVPLLKPDALLVQSCGSEEMFTPLGCRIHFLPSGVDINTFTPVDREDKNRLRRQYELEEGRPLILHVGSIRRMRNILIFNELRKVNDCQILIVGSTSLPQEPDVLLELKKGGCHVLDKYVKNIEEVYQMTDCYVFPVYNRIAAMDFPLSVLEAMACNLPIITTRFGALPRFFVAGKGLFYAEKDNNFVPLLRHVLDTPTEVRTREKILPYSWKLIAEKLEQIYEEVLL